MVGMRPASCGVSCTFHFDGSMMLWFDDSVRSPVVDAGAGSVIVKAIAGFHVVCLLVSEKIEFSLYHFSYCTYIWYHIVLINNSVRLVS